MGRWRRLLLSGLVSLSMVVGFGVAGFGPIHNTASAAVGCYQYGCDNQPPTNNGCWDGKNPSTLAYVVTSEHLIAALFEGDVKLWLSNNCGYTAFATFTCTRGIGCTNVCATLHRTTDNKWLSSYPCANTPPLGYNHYITTNMLYDGGSLLTQACGMPWAAQWNKACTGAY